MFNLQIVRKKIFSVQQEQSYIYIWVFFGHDIYVLAPILFQKYFAFVKSPLLGRNPGKYFYHQNSLGPVFEIWRDCHNTKYMV